MPRPSLPRSTRGRGPRRPYAPRLPPGERREQLLDAALGVIIDQGYGAVSIEAVARVAGVTRPVVYDHFPNLARLLAALVEREEQYALEQVDQIIPDDPGDRDPRELISAGVRSFLDAVRERPKTWTLILFPLEGTPSIVREPVEENRARVLTRIHGLVRWAMAHPGMPQGIDEELLARSIMTLGEESGRLVLTKPDDYTPERFERFAAMLMEILLSGS